MRSFRQMFSLCLHIKMNIYRSMFKQLSKLISNIRSEMRFSNINFLIRLKNHDKTFYRPTLYTDVEVDILTTENVPYVIIVFISKGLILETRKLQLENGFGSFKFYPKFSHAPITNIIAYYVKSNDDIVSDSVSVSLRDRLPNFVSKACNSWNKIKNFLNFQVNLAVSPTTCKPGENVSVSITSTIFSTVSLLAIDQRVLLLKTGNDLSNNEVFDSLNMYNSFWNNEEIFIDFRPHFRPFWFDTYEMRFEVSYSYAKSGQLLRFGTLRLILIPSTVCESRNHFERHR